MKKHISTVLLVLVFLVGVSLLVYPTFSDWWNNRGLKRLLASYDSVVSEMTEQNFSELFEKADAYNDTLRELGSAQALQEPEQIEGYWETLDITGTGIMGYVTIPKINEELPIYHGTSEGVLEIAAGHLQGSSLPVGGKGTHCVLSAHRGLPSARLFTDLDKMEVGDFFTISVLDRLYTYEVDQILIVQPYEMEAIYIDGEEDYCTLLTCTPYGVNSHRMLVRGKRTENIVDPDDPTKTISNVRVVSDALQIDPIIVAPLVAVPILFILLVVLLVTTRKK
ncbi:MAG: class C sortase [Clostridiales bacterium]|nr:class C sortase [Clostridiales bacterium]